MTSLADATDYVQFAAIGKIGSGSTDLFPYNRGYRNTRGVG